MDRTCPTCGSNLATAFQRKGKDDPQFLVFCSRLLKCKSYAQGKMGRGATFMESIVNFRSQFSQLQPELQDSYGTRDKQPV